LTSEAPKDDQIPEVPRRDPVLIETRENELIEKLHKVIQRGIPEDATVREAMLEMRRATTEEPDAQTLVKCLMALALVGGGNVMQEWAEGTRGGWPPQPGPE
jgi:hypothetical protein